MCADNVEQHALTKPDLADHEARVVFWTSPNTTYLTRGFTNYVQMTYSWRRLVRLALFAFSSQLHTSQSSTTLCNALRVFVEFVIMR